MGWDICIDVIDGALLTKAQAESIYKTYIPSFIKEERRKSGKSDKKRKVAVKEFSGIDFSIPKNIKPLSKKYNLDVYLLSTHDESCDRQQYSIFYHRQEYTLDGTLEIEKPCEKEQVIFQKILENINVLCNKIRDSRQVLSNCLNFNLVDIISNYHVRNYKRYLPLHSGKFLIPSQG